MTCRDEVVWDVPLLIAVKVIDTQPTLPLTPPLYFFAAPVAGMSARADVVVQDMPVLIDHAVRASEGMGRGVGYDVAMR